MENIEITEESTPPRPFVTICKETPRRTVTQIAGAIYIIALSLIYAGHILHFVPRGEENTVWLVLSALAGPGLVAIQQYRATFRYNLGAARFCMLLTCCCAVFVLLYGLLPILILISLLNPWIPWEAKGGNASLLAAYLAWAGAAWGNLRWWLTLKEAYEYDWYYPEAKQYTITEFLLISSAIALVLSWARYEAFILR